MISSKPKLFYFGLILALLAQLSLAGIISAPIAFASSSDGDFMFGDVDGNGLVLMYDASLVSQYGAGLIDFTDHQKFVADVDGDGTISSDDADLIAQRAILLIDKFPVEKSDLIVSDFIIYQEDGETELLGSPLAGQSFFVRPVIKNIGYDTATAPFWVENYVDGKAGFSSDWVKVNLEPGQTYIAAAQKQTFNSAGFHGFKTVVDTTAAITEFNENNNSLSKTVTIKENTIGKGDLVITGMIISPLALEGSSYKVNQDISVTITYKNQGTKNINTKWDVDLNFGSSNDDFHFNNINSPETSEPYPSVDNPFEPGEYFGETYTGHFNVSGDLTLHALVDPQNKISELMENNNSYTKTITVQPNGEPQLQLKNSNPGATSKTINPGTNDIILAEIEVSAIGSSEDIDLNEITFKHQCSTKNIHDQISNLYLEDRGTIIPLISDPDPINNGTETNYSNFKFEFPWIVPKEDKIFLFLRGNLLASADPGSYHQFSLVDQNSISALGSSSTQKVNATASYPVAGPTIYVPDNEPAGKHDLFVEDITAYFSAVVGNKISLQLEFDDYYRAEGEEIINYDFSIDAPGAVIGNSLTLPSSKREVWKTVTYNKAGSHTLTVTIDPDNKVEETNENNNSKSYTIEVEPGQSRPEVTSHSVTAISQTSAKIMWQTNEETIGTVKYKHEAISNYSNPITDDIFSTKHEILLQDLQPGTKYYYIIGGHSKTTGLEVLWNYDDNSFTTLSSIIPPPPPPGWTRVEDGVDDMNNFVNGNKPNFSLNSNNEFEFNAGQVISGSPYRGYYYKPVTLEDNFVLSFKTKLDSGNTDSNLAYVCLGNNPDGAYVGLSSNLRSENTFCTLIHSGRRTFKDFYGPGTYGPGFAYIGGRYFNYSSESYYNIENTIHPSNRFGYKYTPGREYLVKMSRHQDIITFTVYESNADGQKEIVHQWSLKAEEKINFKYLSLVIGNNDDNDSIGSPGPVGKIWDIMLEEVAPPPLPPITEKTDLSVNHIRVIEADDSPTGLNQIGVTIKNNSSETAAMLTDTNISLTYGTNFDDINSCVLSNCRNGNKYNAKIPAHFLGKQKLMPQESYEIMFNKQNYLLADIEFEPWVKYLLKAVVDTDNKVDESNENNNYKTIEYTLDTGKEDGFYILSGPVIPETAIYTIGSGKVTIGSIDFNSTLEDIVIEKMSFDITGFNGGDADSIEALYLYDGDTLISSGFNTSTNANTIYLNSVGLDVLAGNSNTTVTLKANINPVIPNTPPLVESGDGIKLTLKPENVVVRGNSGRLYGNSEKYGIYTSNKMYFFKSYPYVTLKSPVDGIISGNGIYNLYNFDVTATLSGDIGLHKVSFNISTSGNLELSNLELYQGDTLVSTSDFNSDGMVDFYLNKTGNRYGKIPAGSTVKYRLLGGINNYSPNNPVSVTVKLMGDQDVNTTEPSIIEPTTVALVDKINHNNFIWSDDLSSANPVESNVWVNGFLIKNFDNEYTISNSVITPNEPEDPDPDEPDEPGISKRLSGRLLLAVEDKGRIYYIYPNDLLKYEVTFGNVMALFQDLALGISNTDIYKIPIDIDAVSDNLDHDNDGFSDYSEVKNGYNPDIPSDPSARGNDALKLDYALGKRLAGKILLQVEDHGRIWYIDQEGQRWEATFQNVMNLFTSLALGITNSDLAMINNGN